MSYLIQALWPVPLAATCVGIFAGFAIKSQKRHGDWADSLGVSMGLFVSSCALLATLIIPTVTHYSVRYERRQCDRYEQATGVDTSWRRWSFWTAECYATLPDGRKVPLGQYIAVTTGEQP